LAAGMSNAHGRTAGVSGVQALSKLSALCSPPYGAHIQAHHTRTVPRGTHSGGGG